MNAVSTVFAVMDRPAKSVQVASKTLYALVRCLAWPGAWLCYGFEITSNQVTCLRFLSPLVFYWLASSNAELGQYLLAVGLFAYTDAIDGVLAGPDFEDKDDTDIGVILDPLADKIFMISVYSFHYQNFPRLVVTTSIGEVMIALLALGYIAYSRNIGRMRACMWGKAKLTLEIATAGLMTWYYASRSGQIETAIMAAGAAVIFCLTMSLLTKVRNILG